MPFRQTKASVLLDLVRGLAAVLVLADHDHNLLFVDYGTAVGATHHPAAMRVLYGLSSAGVEAVVIFFVLSGYLISGSVFRWLANGTWSWRRYLTHRLVRLWVVLLPALLLCAFWDSLGWAHTAGVTGWAQGVTLRLPARGLSWGLLFGNALFLQVVRLRTFGSNRVLWSLAFEFWYYLLFPLGLLACRRQTPGLHRLLYALGFVAVALFAGRAVLGLFPVWLLGTALALMPVPAFGRLTRWVAVVAYPLLVLFFVLHAWHSRWFKLDYVLGAATMLFLWIALSARSAIAERAPVARISRRLAGFSYSLYLVHYPLLACIAAWILPGHPWYPDARHLLAGASLAGVALLYAAGTAAVTEQRTDRVRDWVEARTGVREAGPRRVRPGAALRP